MKRKGMLCVIILLLSAACAAQPGETEVSPTQSPTPSPEQQEEVSYATGCGDEGLEAARQAALKSAGLMPDQVTFENDNLDNTI